MALPVIKIKQQETISSNLPTQNPGQQLITASKLRDALRPIVDATNNMKTIWSGTVRVRTQWRKVDTGNVQCDQNYCAIWVQEDYYDNEYFPALDRGTLDRPLGEYTAEGCRYRIINQGSGMADNTYYNVNTNSQINNVPPATVNYNADVYGGFGLTLNCKVQGGVLVAVQVVNPGSGYCWGKFGSSVTNGNLFHPQDIEINIPGAVVKPIIRYDLSRVLNQAFISGQYQSPCTRDANNIVTSVWSYLNFFVPKADAHSIFGNEIQILTPSGAVPVGNQSSTNGLWPWRRNDGSDTGWTPAIRYSSGTLEFNWNRAMRYPTGPFQDDNLPVKGFSLAVNLYDNMSIFSPPINSNFSRDNVYTFTLAVPIKNLTTDIPGGYWD